MAYCTHDVGSSIARAVSAAHCGIRRFVGQAHTCSGTGRTGGVIAGTTEVGSATCDEIAWCWWTN